MWMSSNCFQIAAAPTVFVQISQSSAHISICVLNMHKTVEHIFGNFEFKICSEFLKV